MDPERGCERTVGRFGQDIFARTVRWITTKKAEKNMQANEITPANQQSRLLHSKKEAAQLLNLSLRTIDNLIAFKELNVRRIGRRVLIPHTAILSFIRTDHKMQEAA